MPSQAPEYPEQAKRHPELVDRRWVNAGWRNDESSDVAIVSLRPEPLRQPSRLQRHISRDAPISVAEVRESRNAGIPRTIAAPYARTATVARYPAEGIARPMTLKAATIVNVLAAGDTAKAVATRVLEVKVAWPQTRSIGRRPIHWSAGRGYIAATRAARLRLPARRQPRSARHRVASGRYVELRVSIATACEALTRPITRS